MKSINNKQLLFVIVSLVFSLSSYAAENGFLQSPLIDANTRQPLQQPSQSNTSTDREPILQTLPAGVDTQIQGGVVQGSTSDSPDSSSTDATTTSTESEPIMQAQPAAVETVIQGGFVQGSTSTSTGSNETATATTDMPIMNPVIIVGVSLAGRVIDPAGLSVADITVKAVRGDETLTTTTDNNGNYQFPLTQGVWSVSAVDLDYDITPAQKVYEVVGAIINRIE